MRIVLGCALAALTSIAGCGSGVDCTAFTPCGGNLVGTWHYAGTCGMANQGVPACPQATVNTSQTTTGTLVLDTNGAFTFSTTVNGGGTVTVPAACLTGVVSCASLNSTSASESQTCTGDPASSCTCNITVTNQTTTASGTYSTMGTTVTTNVAGAITVLPYCVQGNELRINFQNSGVLNGIAVFTR